MKTDLTPEETEEIEKEAQNFAASIPDRPELTWTQDSLYHQGLSEGWKDSRLKSLSESKEKDQHIGKLADLISGKSEDIKKLEKELELKDQKIKELEELIDKLNGLSYS